MSFCVDHYAIAEPRITGVTGTAGIGINRLQFHLAIEVRGLAGRQVELSNLSGRLEAGVSRSGPFKSLGMLLPETSWFATTTDHHNTERPALILDLASEQIEALEQLRGGGSLFFQLDIRLQLREHGKLHLGFDKLVFESNLSDWSKVLQQLGYLDYLVIAVELPVGVPDTLKEAVAQLRSAQQDLVGGRYDSAVGRCRIAMESLNRVVTIEDDQTELKQAFAATDRQRRQALTKRQRADLVRMAVYHYTNLAHHPDSAGTPESFSRQDALFILSAAAGAIWDAAAELRRRV